MRIVDHRVIHRNPYPSHRPEVYSATTVCSVADASGRDVLLAAFRVGAARMSRDGRIALYRSSDLGASWQRVRSPLEAEPDWPSSETHAFAPSLSGSHVGASQDGTVLLTAARMWIAEPGSPDWDEASSGLVDADTVIVRGDGDGRWEAPQVVQARRTPDEWAIPCGPPRPLGGGRWIFPVERHAKTHVPEWLRGYHALALLTSDDGRSWPEAPPMLNDPERRIAHYDQRLALLPDGRIASLVWAHDIIDDVTLPARVGWSVDGGRTWGQAQDTGILGGPVNPVVLPDGRLVGVYPRRTAPRGIRIAVSRDGGATWGPEWVLFDEASARLVGEPAATAGRLERDPALWQDMWGWTFGQPMPVDLDDGTFGVCFFGQGSDRAPAIQWVRVDPDA